METVCGFQPAKRYGIDSMIIDKGNFLQYGIVTDGTPALEFAKKELQKFVEKSCGFRLADYDGQPHYISLGVNALSSETVLSCDLSDLNGDGFYILPKAGNVYIFGQSEKSVIFGVYEFLERFLGVRFLNRDCEYAPCRAQLEIPEKAVKRVPISAQRVYLSNGANDDALYNLRYKFSSDFSVEYEEIGLKSKWYKRIPTGHNSNFFVPYERYKDTHPEFFSVYRYEDFRLFEAVELCYTNGLTEDGQYDDSVEPSVVSVATASFLQFMEEEPSAEYFMFGRIDNADARCHCEKCEKARKKYGDSGIMIAFMNAIAKKLRQKFAENGKPFDKKLVTFAYLTTVEPPVKEGKPICETVVPDPALYIRYAPIGADFTYAFDDERQLETVRAQIAGWSALTKNLMIWDYNVNFSEYFWYFPNLYYLQRNMRLFKKLGLHYVMKQGANNVGQIWLDELRSYVCSKLFWDVDLDVDELVREYISLYFGLGAEAVMQYVNEMEGLYKTLIDGGFRVKIGGESALFDPELYPLSMLQRQEKQIESGIAAVENSSLADAEKAVFVKRLKTVLMTPLRMIVRNAGKYFGGENLDYEEKYRRVADSIGVKNSGEVVPIYIDFVSGGKTAYKIITGKNPTAEEKRAAEYLQGYVAQQTGVTVPIETDAAIYPAYWERGIMVGKNAMTKEFYKSGLDISDLSYFIDVKGWCIFVDSDYDIFGAAQAFVKECVRKGDGEKSLEIVSCKRIGKR